MIKDEAYNKMIEGYPVTHKLFNPKEYLYMDENFIIRSQDGEEFENNWDARVTPEWNTDWYIYKGQLNKNKSIPKIKEKEKVNYDTISNLRYDRLNNNILAVVDENGEETGEYLLNNNSGQKYIPKHEEEPKLSFTFEIILRILCRIVIPVIFGVTACMFGSVCVIVGLALYILAYVIYSIAIRKGDK